MVNVGVIGIGKMGISHLSILGANPKVNIVGIADNSRITTDILEKHSPFRCYLNYKEMIAKESIDAIIVATPTKYHFPIVKDILENNVHVFVEKPFCLNTDEGKELIEIAEKNQLINQVGYHNKFIGTFLEAKNLINKGSIGNVFHFSTDMYGPVVIRKKDINWRSKSNEGGGCLMDYAAHSIDLINYIIGDIKNIEGVVMKSIYSKDVEDAIFALLRTEEGISGVMNVNWSDETYRKMSTTITVQGTRGKIVVDATEMKVFLKEEIPGSRYSKGWNIIHINELCEDVEFYLRGEEYSAQIEHFINVLEGNEENTINTFFSAMKTDRVIEQIKKYNTEKYA